MFDDRLKLPPALAGAFSSVFRSSRDVSLCVYVSGSGRFDTCGIVVREWNAEGCVFSLFFRGGDF